MRTIITILTLLTFSATIQADESEKRAVKAIETVMMMKADEKILKPIKKILIKKGKKIAKKFETKPTPTIKAIAGLLQVARKIAEPTLDVKTEEGKLKIKLLEFKQLRLNYNSDNSNLKLNFETDLKKTTLGLKMSF